MIQLTINPAEIEFIAFTPQLIVPRHLISYVKVVRHSEFSIYDHIEVGLIDGQRVDSESGVSDIPAYIRRQLGVSIT